MIREISNHLSTFVQKFFILSLSWFLWEIKSRNPFSNRNSLVWNPSGRSLPVVSLTTLGPAKAIKALGSAIVVGDEVVASMKRKAKPGEFRSNVHLGGSVEKYNLTEQENESAIKAAKVLGLSVAGVDLIQSNRGPLVLEVNSSPGLEGIEKASGIDVAGKIIEYLEDQHSKRDKSKPIDI